VQITTQLIRLSPKGDIDASLTEGMSFLKLTKVVLAPDLSSSF
jgi:hypothetical protein